MSDATEMPTRRYTTESRRNEYDDMVFCATIVRDNKTGAALSEFRSQGSDGFVREMGDVSARDARAWLYEHFPEWFSSTAYWDD